MKHAEAGAKAAIEKAVEAEAEGMRLKMLLERERRGRGTTEAPDSHSQPSPETGPRPETQSPEGGATRADDMGHQHRGRKPAC